MTTKSKTMTNTRDMLRKAQREGYAVPAFNIHNLETLHVIIEAANELRSPVIIAASPGTVKYAGLDYVHGIVDVAARTNDIPIALHLDHHVSLEAIQPALDLGVKSVMIDGSKLSFEENVALTKEVVDQAHTFDATVEAELGKVMDSGAVTNVNDAYTDPALAAKFVEATGVNSLAVAIGTGHGVYEEEPKLDLDRLAAIQQNVDVPLVLHGASGISSEEVRKCIERGVAKVNISTELKIPFTKGLRAYLIDNPDASDLRKYMVPAKAGMKKAVVEKIKMCMSDGKA